MKEEKPILEPQKEPTPQIINIQNENNSNKIIIENEPSEFEKPEEIKNSTQEINPSLPAPISTGAMQNPSYNNSSQINNINIP